MYNVLTVKRVLSDAGGGSHLLHPQAILIVDEAERFAALAHALQLTSLGPGIGPSAITQRVTNSVIGNGGTVERRQLVLPVRIAIGVAVGFHRRANGARCIRISGLAQDVAAQIVGIHPSGAAAACRGVMRVVSADQLSQLVINIGDLLHAIADSDDISAVVVDVAQVSAHREEPSP